MDSLESSGNAPLNSKFHTKLNADVLFVAGRCQGGKVFGLKTARLLKLYFHITETLSHNRR